jgi:hypothetical protein
MEKTFYFATGVHFSSNNYLAKGDVWCGNGTRLIPFICKDVPEKAKFKFACDNDCLPESKNENILVTPILGGNLLSKFAYFQLS